MHNGKYKILILCDNPRGISGVALQANYLIKQLIATGKYTFRVFGGAIKHEKYDVIAADSPDYLVKPVDVFGTREELRNVLLTEKPDALILFNDPRFFLWIWEMADEIRQICPIGYWHVWDNDPAPFFNRVLYEDTDLINCLSHKTYEMVKEVYPEGNINYIPHALPEEIFHPLPTDQVFKIKEELLGLSRVDHFVCSWVNRNANRKKAIDLMWSWKLFLDQLEAKYKHRRATLILHTDIYPHSVEREGYNLMYASNSFNLTENVKFSTQKLPLEHMNFLCNISDCGVNISSNEGFGLNPLEMLYCGKPIVALKTGGLTRQVIDHRDGTVYGVALEPAARTFIGGGSVPYIYADHVKHEEVADAFMTLFDMKASDRKALGLKGREYALEEFNMKKMIENWDSTLTDTIEKWKTKKPLWSLQSL